MFPAIGPNFEIEKVNICINNKISTNIRRENVNESILIIEDEVGLIKMLKRLLDKEGFQEIYQAESGAEALKNVKEHKIDLILLDVMLPDTNGFDLCQQIRDISDVPIIFLTARTTDIDKLTGFYMGAMII